MGGFPCDLTSVLQYSVLENLPSNYFLNTVQQETDTWNAE